MGNKIDSFSFTIILYTIFLENFNIQPHLSFDRVPQMKKLPGVLMRLVIFCVKRLFIFKIQRYNNSERLFQICYTGRLFMENDSELLSLDAGDIKRRIFTIRGRQVMLDSDLADLYGYEVKNLNRQVKRNIRRFPKDFMFQLAQNEMEILRCQNVTANVKSRTLPYAFTEQGIYMLAAVLRGELAEQQSIFIMRAFREMRHFVSNNAALFDRISKVELRQLEYQKKTDERLDQIFECISNQKETNQKLFFDGQIYDAFTGRVTASGFFVRKKQNPC